MTWVVLLVGLLLGAALGLWFARKVARWQDRHPNSAEKWIRHIYRYVDQRIGATANENQIRADLRFRVLHPRFKGWWRLWWLVPPKRREAVANYFWAIPRAGAGTSPLPEVERMTRYVALEVIDPQPRRLTIDAISAVRFYPSSEVSALAEGFPRSLLPWVAWALRTPPNELIFAPEPMESLTQGGYIRVARKAPEPEFQPTVPVGVNADA